MINLHKVTQMEAQSAPNPKNEGHVHSSGSATDLWNISGTGVLEHDDKRRVHNKYVDRDNNIVNCL